MQQEPQEKKTKRTTFRDYVSLYKSEFKFRKELIEFFRFMFESPKLRGFMTWVKPGVPAEFKHEQPNYWDRRMLRFRIEGAPRGCDAITQFVDYDRGNTVTDYLITVDNGLCWRDVLITPDEYSDDPKQWSPETGTLEQRRYRMSLLLRRISYGNDIAARFPRYALQTITPICELSEDQKKFISETLTPYKRKDD